MPESEGGRRIEQAKLALPVIKKELDRAQSKENAMPGCEGEERTEQAKLAFPGTKKELDRAQSKELAMPGREVTKRNEQAKLIFPVTYGELLKQNLSVKFRRAQQRATALVMRGITRTQHKDGMSKERGVGAKKD